MSKLLPIVGLSLAALSAPAGAITLGPNPAVCEATAGRPAALVQISGFKNRVGTVRVRAFEINSPNLFRKEGAILRVDIRTPADGPVAVCVPLPAAGVYAFDVRHDANGDGDTNKSDGGGMSGNPRYSVWQVLTKQKPSPAKVAVQIGNGVKPVPVVLNYFQGGSFGPLKQTASR